MNIRVIVNDNQNGGQSISILDEQTNTILSSVAVPLFWALGEPDILEDGSKAIFETGNNEVLVVNLENPYQPTTEIWQRKNKSQKEELWLEFQ